MSYVITSPEFMTSAAEDLAGIRATLGEATAAAAAPTTGVAAAAADDVSAAIAKVFGSYGQEFQAVSGQATVFHDQFVNVLRGGAAAYVSTELANAEQALSNVVSAPATALQGGAASLLAGPTGAVQQAVSQIAPGTPAAVTALRTIGSPALLSSGATGLASVAGPYQTLFANTSANLQALGGAIAANPLPFLHQVVLNQLAYAQQTAANIAAFLQNFPASVPTAIQNFLQALASFDPLAYVQWLVNSGQLAWTSFQNIVAGIQAGLPGLTAGLQDALRALLAGDFSGATDALRQGLVAFLQPGVDLTVTDNLTIDILTRVTGDVGVVVTPTGLIGDVFSAVAVPGQAAQNFTDLLPAGTIPAKMSQNFTNVIKTLTDTRIASDVTINARIIPPVINSLGVDNTFGMPLALAVDALGAPVVTAQALQSSVSAFTTAVQAGDGLGAVTALVDAPAVVANGFLNGQTTLPISLDTSVPVLGTVGINIDLPMNGILVPMGSYGGEVVLPIGTIPLDFGGTPLGGIVPALLTWAPEQLAAAITPTG